MKERLTGAIILVVLVVAIVPELLSGPASAPAPKATPPPDGAPIRAYTIDLGETAGRPSAPGDALPAAATSATAAAPGPAPAAPAAAARTAATPTQGPLAAAAMTTARPRPVAVSASAPAPPRITTSSAKAAFLVQAGTFSSRENADRLARQLGAKGFQARVSSAGSGGRVLYRVRIGPPGDRAAAAALLARLKAAGSGGAIVPAP
jgi:rare lipoprotein A